MATFPPEVERWRALVARYFPAELVDKALWTIQHESGGNPEAVGDNGVARGLFQVQDNRAFEGRPSADQLDNPEFNIRYAAQELGAASGDFGAWGEGTSYQGQPFGAFGHNQYPGSAGGEMPGPALPSLPFTEDDYLQKYARYQRLQAELYDPLLGSYKNPNDPRLEEMFRLEAEIKQYEDAKTNGARDYSSYLDWYDRSVGSDPGKVSADAAAAKYDREFRLADAVEGATARDLQEQRLTQDSANGEFAAFRGSNHFNGGAFRAPATNLPDKDQLFQGNMKRIAANLPEVPVFQPQRPQSPFSSGSAFRTDPSFKPQGYGPEAPAPDPSFKPEGYGPGGLVDPSLKPQGYGPGSYADDPSFKPQGYGPALPENPLISALRHPVPAGASSVIRGSLLSGRRY